MKTPRLTIWTAAALAGLAALAAAPAAADQVINDDCIVTGSQCIGFDCVNGESFGFDTLRLKENNTRMHFDDTSNSASFPRNDWRLVANDSTNGGAEYLAIEDSTAGRQVFRVEAGARANALYVEDDGDIGIGTSTPVVDVHVVTGNTPTLRLEQDGSSGFQAQTWDVAGNEANFFIRDVTMGSTLALRIRPGAPTSAIDVAANGNVGFGEPSPQNQIHVADSGGPRIRFEDNGTADEWVFGMTGNQHFFINDLGRAGTEFQINVGTGNVTIDADLTINGQCTEVDGACAPDYVFEPGYELPSLEELSAFVAENRHLPNVPSAEEIAASGINMRRFNYALLEKIEELVLYTLAQQETIDELAGRLAVLEGAAN